MGQEDKVILLDHGEGGAATSRLVKDIFLKHLGGPKILEDAAVLRGSRRLAFTTDSFVVTPLEFPGGDIGKLAACGTINDLSVAGATPAFLSAGFVMEEGLQIALLERIVASMARTCAEAGVKIVTGDTKVVPKGDADGVFINTSGIGHMIPKHKLSSASCRPGDRVLVSGPVGDHGMAVAAAREGFRFESDLKSDCQPINDLTTALLQAAPHAKCMRDPTRGGLATVLVEFSAASKCGFLIEEGEIPVRPQVRAACEILGLDPFYIACEGRLVAVVPEAEAAAALEALRSNSKGRDAIAIGTVVRSPKQVIFKTKAGGLRPILALEGAQLPRIC